MFAGHSHGIDPTVPVVSLHCRETSLLFISTTRTTTLPLSEVSFLLMQARLNKSETKVTWIETPVRTQAP